MRQKRATAIALLCGVLCAACVLAFMASVQGDAERARAEALSRYGGDQVDVYVATRDIAAGERVDSSCLEQRTWVSDLLPEGCVLDAADVVGKSATSPIYQGEVVLSRRFEGTGADLDVPAGTTAVSVPAKASSAVGGALVAGMRVDIYATGDSGTQAIARDALVLGASSGSGSGSWVTVAVANDRVQELVAAVEKTELYFSLPSESAG